MNAFRYSPEMEKFLYDHFEEYNDKKMAEEFNRVFETEISWHQIRHFRRKHGIRGEHHQRHSEIFTDEIRAFIEANYKGTGYKDMALMIWHEFGKWYQPKQIRSYYRNHKLSVARRSAAGNHPRRVRLSEARRTERRAFRPS